MKVTYNAKQKALLIVGLRQTFKTGPYPDLRTFQFFTESAITQSINYLVRHTNKFTIEAQKTLEEIVDKQNTKTTKVKKSKSRKPELKMTFRAQVGSEYAGDKNFDFRSGVVCRCVFDMNHRLTSHNDCALHTPRIVKEIARVRANFLPNPRCISAV